MFFILDDRNKVQFKLDLCFISFRKGIKLDGIFDEYKSLLLLLDVTPHLLIDK